MRAKQELTTETTEHWEPGSCLKQSTSPAVCRLTFFQCAPPLLVKKGLTSGAVGMYVHGPASASRIECYLYQRLYHQVNPCRSGGGPV